MPHRSGPGYRALRKGRQSLTGGVYHITTTTAARMPLFDDFLHARAAAATLTKRSAHGDACLLAWVLMPDHMHLLLQLGVRDSLPSIMARIKARSAKAVKRANPTVDTVWAKGYHDRALRREDDLRTVARYIVANPLRAGLTARCGDYPFWDAVWLP